MRPSPVLNSAGRAGSPAGWQDRAETCRFRPKSLAFARAGWVAERLKAAVLKTASPQGLVGSNPTPSAISLSQYADIADSFRPRAKYAPISTPNTTPDTPGFAFERRCVSSRPVQLAGRTSRSQPWMRVDDAARLAGSAATAATLVGPPAGWKESPPIRPPPQWKSPRRARKGRGPREQSADGVAAVPCP